MKLICKVPTNPFEWMFIYLVTGPVVGVLLMLPVTLFLAGGINLFAVLVLLMGSFIFAVPAGATGLIMYGLRNQITDLWRLLVCALSGAVLTWLWSWLVWGLQFDAFFHPLLMVIGWLSTCVIAAVFFRTVKDAPSGS